MAKKTMTPEQLKNLPQYKNKTQEELIAIAYGINHGDSFENQIEKRIESFKEDYDLSDMTANDMLSLRELAKIYLLLDDISTKHREILDAENPDFNSLEKLGRIENRLRTDASKIQQDLNITRKARQDAGTQQVAEFIEDLKHRAKKFVDDRLCSIFCPECKMLLSKVWFLDKSEKSIIKLTCPRKSCGHSFEIDSTQFINNKYPEKVGPPL